MGATISLAPPSDGPITQFYGNMQPDGNPHAGQDWGYSDDDGNIYPDAYAMDAGEVVWAGDSRDLGWPNFLYINPDFDRSDNVDSSGGNVVALRHWYGITSYGHLESIDVVVGQHVAKRQRLGTVGTSGFSSGKHLHADLILDPVNFNTPTYGRSNLNDYLEEPMTLTTEQSNALFAIRDALFFGGKSTLYGASIMSLIDDVPRRTANAVAGYPVVRDGKKVAWVQDTADGTSLAMSLQRSVLPAMAESLKIDPEVVRAAFTEAVKGASVTVTIGADDSE